MPSLLSCNLLFHLSVICVVCVFVVSYPYLMYVCDVMLLPWCFLHVPSCLFELVCISSHLPFISMIFIALVSLSVFNVLSCNYPALPPLSLCSPSTSHVLSSLVFSARLLLLQYYILALLRCFLAIMPMSLVHVFQCIVLHYVFHLRSMCCLSFNVFSCPYYLMLLVCRVFVVLVATLGLATSATSTDWRASATSISAEMDPRCR